MSANSNNVSKWAWRGGIVAFVVGAVIYAKQPPTVDADEIQYSPVKIQSLSNNLNTSGVLLPAEHVWVNSQVSTPIANILVKKGQEVKIGDVLVELNLDDLNETLANKQRAFALKTVNFDQQKIDANLAVIRAETSLQDIENKLANWVNNPDGLLLQIDQLKAEVAGAKNSQKLLNKKIAVETEIHQVDIADLEAAVLNNQIVSPVDGVVTESNFAVGEQVEAGSNLIKIAKRNPTFVSIAISESSSQVLAGKNTIRLGKDNIGKITQITPDPDTLQLYAQIEAEKQITQPLFSNIAVSIEYGKINNAIQVQKGAYINAGQRFVFVKEDDKLIKKQVKFGVENEYYIQIIEGLEKGDDVVISNTRPFWNLEKVKVVGGK